MNNLTYAEELELALLFTDGEREDHDTIPQRVIINRGLAERCNHKTGHSMIRITSAGIDKLGELAQARGEPDDIFNGNHGFG